MTRSERGCFLPAALVKLQAVVVGDGGGGGGDTGRYVFINSGKDVPWWRRRASEGPPIKKT